MRSPRLDQLNRLHRELRLMQATTFGMRRSAAMAWIMGNEKARAARARTVAMLRSA